MDLELWPLPSLQELHHFWVTVSGYLMFLRPDVTLYNVTLLFFIVAPRDVLRPFFNFPVRDYLKGTKPAKGTPLYRKFTQRFHVISILVLVLFSVALAANKGERELYGVLGLREDASGEMLEAAWAAESAPKLQGLAEGDLVRLERVYEYLVKGYVPRQQYKWFGEKALLIGVHHDSLHTLQHDDERYICHIVLAVLSGFAVRHEYCQAGLIVRLSLIVILLFADLSRNLLPPSKFNIAPTPVVLFMHSIFKTRFPFQLLDLTHDLVDIVNVAIVKLWPLVDDGSAFMDVPKPASPEYQVLDWCRELIKPVWDPIGKPLAKCWKYFWKTVGSCFR